MITKIRLSIIYSWFIRTLTILLPNHPLFRRLRGFLYSLLMNSCGGNFEVSSSVIINSLSGLSVGKNVRISHNVVIIGTNISIGDNVIIGPNTVISSANHVFDGDSFRNSPSIGAPVVIHEGSWVSGNCTLTEGAVLPPKSVLAAGAVLTKNFSIAYGIYAGVPAKLLKTFK